MHHPLKPLKFNFRNLMTQGHWKEINLSGRIYTPGENDMTQDIIVWKDISKEIEMTCDSPKVIDASMRPQTLSNRGKIL